RCRLNGKVKRRPGKERSYRLSRLQKLGSSLVGDSKSEGILARARRLFLATGENRRAGSVGNRESITEILFSISQSVEWQEIKRAVGHENEVLSLEIGAQRRNKFAIQRFQVAMGRAQERLFKSPNGFTAHAKLGDVKSKQLQKMSSSREHRHRLNVDVLARDNGGNEAIAGHKVFDKGCILWKMSLQL